MHQSKTNTKQSIKTKSLKFNLYHLLNNTNSKGEIDYNFNFFLACVILLTIFSVIVLLPGNLSMALIIFVSAFHLSLSLADFLQCCRFSAIPADFLQYLRIFCNTCIFSAYFLQIFCNTCRFSADFLQYLRIFCNAADFLHIFCNSYGFSATLCRFSAYFLQYLRILCTFSVTPADFLRSQLRRCYKLYSATFFSCSISIVITGAFCALTNLPQLNKESTKCKLCHIDAVTVKNHLLVLVVEDITRGILVGSDLKMVKTNSLW